MSEQKWREVYESVDGNCWSNSNDQYVGLCKTCNNIHANPPPTLDALFEVAEKFGYRDVVIGKTLGGEYFADIINSGSEIMYGNTPQLALLNALHQAITPYH